MFNDGQRWACGWVVREDVSAFLFDFGKRGTKIKARVVDLAVRSALPRLHRYLEKRARGAP